MERTLHVSAWVFIFLAAGYDSHFAWRYREALQGWELNPVARWAAGQLGLAAVLAFKFAGLAFAAGLAAYCVRRRAGLARVLTVAALGVYGLLALHYAVGERRTEYPVASLEPAVQLTRPGLEE